MTTPAIGPDGAPLRRGRVDVAALQTVRRPSAAELRRRLPRLLGGLGIIAFGTALMVRSELGLSPYEALHQGVSFNTPLTIGQASILVGALAMLAWIPLRQRPGLGTVVNVVGVGLMVDAWLLVPWAPTGLGPRLAVNAVGVVTIGLGIGLYIGAGLGQGPRDGLLTGLALHGVPLWVTRGVLEVSSLALGWWLGGTVGVGTVLFAVAVPFLVQYSARWTVGVAAPRPGAAA